MYRLFSMQEDGRLYQLGSSGWVREDGTNFLSLQGIRDFLFETVLPPLPCALDSYIGQVDLDGTILSTEPVIPAVRG